MSFSEWGNYRWSDLCTLEYGKSLKKYRDKSEGVPVYGTNGHIGYTDKSLYDNDGIIIGRKGAYRGVHYSKTPFYVIDTAFYMKISRPEILDTKFAYYHLLTKDINSMDSGSAIPSTSREDFYNMTSLVPTLQEQKAIAHILSTLDEKIEVNSKINKTLEEMAQAIFKHWFVDFEFPNEDGDPYKSSGGEMVDSELGLIPKGWVVGRISDISQRIYSGGTPRTSEDAYWQGNLPWMSSGETRNSFLISTEKRITELAVKNSSTKLALRYCTAIASAGQGMTRGQSTLLLIDTFVNQSIIVVQAKNGFEFYNFCNLSSRYDEMRGLSDSHSIRGSLTTKMIFTMPILIPNENVLFTFNNVVIRIFESIENKYYENNRLTSIRDTLLPKLMSGEIRVPIDNEQ